MAEWLWLAIAAPLCVGYVVLAIRGHCYGADGHRHRWNASETPLSRTLYLECSICGERRYPEGLG